MNHLNRRCRKVAAWESTQAAGVEAEYVLEISSILDPLVEHFCEGRALGCVRVCGADVTELFNDLNAAFMSPLADLNLLKGD